MCNFVISPSVTNWFPHIRDPCSHTVLLEATITVNHQGTSAWRSLNHLICRLRMRMQVGHLCAAFTTRPSMRHLAPKLMYSRFRAATVTTRSRHCRDNRKPGCGGPKGCDEKHVAARNAACAEDMVASNMNRGKSVALPRAADGGFCACRKHDKVWLTVPRLRFRK